MDGREQLNLARHLLSEEIPTYLCGEYEYILTSSRPQVIRFCIFPRASVTTGDPEGRKSFIDGSRTHLARAMQSCIDTL